jgi:hypothetical protein
VSKSQITSLKQKIESELYEEKESEIIVDQNNRRSDRLSRSPMNFIAHQNTTDSKVGFMVLVRLMRDFKEIHKDELYKYKLLDLDQNSSKSCRASSSGRSNKRIIKMKKIEEEQKEEKGKVAL